VLRFKRLNQLPNHIIENVNGLGRKPGRRPHNRRCHPGTGMVSTKNEPKRIDKKEATVKHWSILHRSTYAQILQRLGSQSVAETQQWRILHLFKSIS
jgi:hypothetical protein